MQTFTKKVMKRGTALFVALVLSLSSVTILVPVINNQVASANGLNKLHYLTMEPGNINLETGVTTKSVYIHPESYGNNDINTLSGSAKITVNAPAGLLVATSESGSFGQSAEISQKRTPLLLFWKNQKIAGTFYFKADVSGTYQVPVSATFYNGLKKLNGNLTVNATRTPSLAPTNLRISKDGNLVTSGSSVNSKWISGDVVLDFDKVTNSDQYITELTYTPVFGATIVTDLWNTYNNTWLVNKGIVAQGEFSTHGDGTYSYRVKSRSAINGDWSEYSNSVSLIYDSQKPTVELISPSTSLFNSEGAVLQVNANDNIALYQITANIYQKGSDKVFHSTTTRDINAASDIHSVSFSTIYNGNKLPDGDYYVKYNALDKAGNLSETYTFDFTIDDTAPYMLLRQGESGPVIESGSTINNKDMNIHIEKENTSTIYMLQPNGETLMIDGKLDANYDGDKFSLDWALKTDGLYIFYVQDEAGNRSADYLLTIDTTKPIVEGIADKDINTNTFTITATDATSGIKGVTGNIYKYDPSHSKAGKDGYYLYKSNSTKTSNTLIIDVAALDLTDGKYYIRYNARDNADNISETKNFHFVVDHTAPIVQVNLNREKFAASGDTVKASDKPEIQVAGKDLAEIIIYNGIGTEGTKKTSWTSVGEYASTYKGISWLGDGVYTVVAVDKAGNISEGFVITLDNTAPATPTNLLPVHDAVVSGGPKQSWDKVDDAVHYIYESYTDESMSKLIYSATTKAPSRTVGGKQTIDIWWRVAAVDQVGNISAFSPIQKLIVDNTAPSAPTVDLENSDATKITGTADPDEELIVEVEDFNDNDMPGIIDRDGKNWIFTPTEQLLEGDYNINAYSVDKANNRSELKSIGFTIPSPVVEAPEEVNTDTTENTDTTNANINIARAIIARNTNNGVASNEQIEEAQTESTSASEKDDTEVLGAQTTRESNGNTEVEATTESGFQFWWLIILATIAGFFWFILAKRRKEA